VRAAVAVVREWELARADGEPGVLKAASLVKQVVAHVALAVLDDLDEPIRGDITARHVLTHTTGLPNWRPEGEQLRPLRPPGRRWGYSGEGFVLLLHHLERRTGSAADELVRDVVLDPLGMLDSRLDDPEPGFHGYRPLRTTAADYGRFLAHVLTLDDERWQPLWPIDEELAWSAGWGLEIGPPVHGWQWGQDEDAANFVIGCPSTGDGVVVLTDDPVGGRAFYRRVVERELPRDHPSLEVEHNATWIGLFA
jgi:CubicO group peptidase (beta-lactamase class C family)